MVRTVRPSGQGRLQALCPVNGYSTVREKEEFTLIMEGHEFKSRRSKVIDPPGQYSHNRRASSVVELENVTVCARCSNAVFSHS